MAPAYNSLLFFGPPEKDFVSLVESLSGGSLYVHGMECNGLSEIGYIQDLWIWGCQNAGCRSGSVCSCMWVFGP